MVVRHGGFTTGGFNFDAKVRRQSIDPADLFHGHIGGLDSSRGRCSVSRPSPPMAVSIGS